MRNLTMGIYFADEEGNVQVKRKVSTNWNVNTEEDLVKEHSIYFKDEVSNILSEHLKLQITPQVIKEMVEELSNMEVE